MDKLKSMIYFQTKSDFLDIFFTILITVESIGPDWLVLSFHEVLVINWMTLPTIVSKSRKVWYRPHIIQKFHSNQPNMALATASEVNLR